MVKVAAVPETNGSKAVKIHAPKKLDIACGSNKQVGFKGIDLGGDADIIHNLEVFPWPIKSNSVEQVFCSHYAEHIPHWSPQHPIPDVGAQQMDGWWLFFDELYRVMKTDATAEFIHPYAMSARAFWDPTHTRYIHEMTWHYLNREWREANGLDHYCGDCNFEVVTLSMLGVQDDYLARNAEHQAYTRNHYWNVVQDLGVLIKKL